MLMHNFVLDTAVMPGKTLRRTLPRMNPFKEGKIKNTATSKLTRRVHHWSALNPLKTIKTTVELVVLGHFTVCQWQ